MPQEAIETALGRPLVQAAARDGAPQAPGQLASHYAPRARLRLQALAVALDEAALDFGGVLAGAASVARLDLSPSGDVVEAAANLFAFLRTLDKLGAAAIAVAPIPAQGLGAAINDRMRRAAAPRDG